MFVTIVHVFISMHGRGRWNDLHNVINNTLVDSKYSRCNLQISLVKQSHVDRLHQNTEDDDLTRCIPSQT